MSLQSESAANPRPPFEVLMPAVQTVPVVFASPHSGADYPAEFLAASRLDPLSLRKSEDCFVDEIFAAAPAHGAPLIRALFPRAFVDPNREPFELDPAMFADALPAYANVNSPRVAAGLGTIARVVATGEDIYGKRLYFAEAKARIDRYYRPYHEALRRLLLAARQRFGFCVLIDCHSMPSIGAPMERDAGHERVDFVLGDCHASSCAPWVIDEVERLLRRQGYAVARNMPYSGGFTTQHYGQPAENVHALQIEINRALYMDEPRFRHGPGFDALRRRMTELIRDFSAMGSAAAAQ
jgi:N-formylglutamate amidohydrolase